MLPAWKSFFLCSTHQNAYTIPLLNKGSQSWPIVTQSSPRRQLHSPNPYSLTFTYIVHSILHLIKIIPITFYIKKCFPTLIITQHSTISYHITRKQRRKTILCRCCTDFKAPYYIPYLSLILLSFFNIYRYLIFFLI